MASQGTGDGAPSFADPNGDDEARDIRTYPKNDDSDDVSGHVYIEPKDSEGETVRDS
ncbi:MAG: hypothetical protein QOG80_1667 [Pseudonocardiales bacterium]|nr:hypothetical protein [Pseudonocardiales bacterium]